MSDNASADATQRAFNEGTLKALDAAFLLIGDDALQKELMDEKRAAQVLERFKLPASSRPRLLNLVGRVGHKVSYSVADSVARLATADPSKVQEIAAAQIQLLTSYYNISLEQARRSFWSALGAAVVGLIFFLAALGFLLFYQQTPGLASASIVSGSLIEVISAINFYLYGKTSAQFAEFHTRLGHTQRYLLANSLCEGLEGEFKQKARADLVKAIGGIK